MVISNFIMVLIFCKVEQLSLQIQCLNMVLQSLGCSGLGLLLARTLGVNLVKYCKFPILAILVKKQRENQHRDRYLCCWENKLKKREKKQTLIIYIFFREFQLTISAHNDSFLSSDQNINHFLMQVVIETQIFYTTINKLYQLS